MNGRVGPASGNDCLQHLAGRRSRSILWPATTAACAIRWPAVI